MDGLRTCGKTLTVPPWVRSCVCSLDLNHLAQPMSLQIQPKPEEQQPSADLTLSVLTWLEENKKTLAIGFAVV
ncbi:MAG: hypothetical protein RJB04_1201, partial [Verrucomicrobiota bacterium]